MKKTIFITGSTDGIGKLAAIQLAKEGHEVYLHGRNPDKLSRVVEEVIAESGNSGIKGYTADFSDLASVRALAHQLQTEVPKLDVLINNAGIFKSPAAVNEKGLDIRFVVNYLAPYLLTKELISLLQKGTNPRIVNLSSAAQAPVSHAALQGKGQLSERDAYAQSKLALTMWSMDLANSLPGISVVPVNPGSLLNTNMVREAFGKFWSSADKGANILRDLAVSNDHEGMTGRYFDNDAGSYGTAHPDAYDASKIRKLLTLTESMVGAG